MRGWCFWDIFPVAPFLSNALVFLARLLGAMGKPFFFIWYSVSGLDRTAWLVILGFPAGDALLG